MVTKTRLNKINGLAAILSPFVTKKLPFVPFGGKARQGERNGTTPFRGCSLVPLTMRRVLYKTKKMVNLEKNQEAEKMIIQTGDGTMAAREARGTCVSCDTIRPQDDEGRPCRVCGLVVVTTNLKCEFEDQASMMGAMQ